jgi:hypothetical protein
MAQTSTRLTKISLLLMSCALTFALGSLAISFQSLYFKTYPYFFDPVVYSWQNIGLFEKLAQSNRFQVALQEWLTNPKCPIRTVPLILLAPHLLANNIGYIATALPALFVFLMQLGWTVHQRTRSLLYAMATMVLFCSIPGLLNLRYGLGAYWLDLPAALWVGAAALCLVQFLDTKHLRWLMLASTWAAFACLSRYIAIAYLLFACGPILFFYLAEQWYHKRSFRYAVLPPLAASFLPLAVLSGYYLIAQFSHNLKYYTTYGYALKNGALSSFLFVTGFLLNSFFGTLLSCILVIIFCINLFLSRQQLLKQSSDLLLTGWYAISIILFLVALGTSQAFQSTMYAAPLLFFAAVSPVPTNGFFKGKIRRFRTFLASGAIVIALLLIQQTIYQNTIALVQVPPYFQEHKQLDKTIAGILVQENSKTDNLKWGAFFNEYSTIPTVEAFYQSGQLINGYPAHFTIHKAYWRAFFPGLNAHAIKLKVYAQAVKEIDVAVVLQKPGQAAKIPILGNRISRIVAKHMSAKMARDPNWKPIAVIETQTYGKLVAYRNLARLQSSASP